jgi:hypothetical protein
MSVWQHKLGFSYSFTGATHQKSFRPPPSGVRVNAVSPPPPPSRAHGGHTAGPALAGYLLPLDTVLTLRSRWAGRRPGTPWRRDERQVVRLPMHAV